MQVDLKDLKNLLHEIAPGRFWGNLGARTNPLTPLLFFCAFTMLAAVSITVFSEASYLLKMLAFGLFATVIGVSILVYLVCLVIKPDLLRSESFSLDILRMSQSETANGDVPPDKKVGPTKGSRHEQAHE